MDHNTFKGWGRPWTGHSIDERTLPSSDELGTIIAVAEELADWLQEKYGIVKEKAKQQAEKFKKKILKFKNLNGQAVPARNR
jgi:hypothetical protein